MHKSSWASPERERKSLHARIEKLDPELSISDGRRLSDQLIQPLVANLAVEVVAEAIRNSVRWAAPVKGIPGLKAA